MIPKRQIPPDPIFPHMPTLCDEKAMKDIFEKHVGNGHRPDQGNWIQDCRILHIRYKPGRYVMVLYEILFRNRPGQPDAPEMWYVRAFKKGKSHSNFLEAQALQTQERQPNPRILHFREIESIAWGFPYDRKMVSLPNALDRDMLRSQVLPSLLGPQRAAEWDVVDLTSEVMHYVPEHTCTMRVTMHLHNRMTGETTSFTVFGKTFANHQGMLSYQALQQLWNSPARKIGALVIPEPLAFDPETNTLWQSSLIGIPLTHFPLSDPRMCGWMEKSGATLATLHGTPLMDLPIGQTPDIMERLDHATRILAPLRPACQESLYQLSTILAQQASHFPSYPSATLHGDPHRKNLFLQDETVALIDLDSITTGPPLYDVGSCLASVWYRAALGEISTPLAKTLSIRFLKGYQQNVSWPLSEAEVVWYIAAFLVTEQATRCATTFKADRLDIIEHLIHLAKSLLSRDILFNGMQLQTKNCLSAQPGTH
ncbi:MAG: phosphotransferase [Nitrospirota bacterium]|nr:phosphotransferase [Nitrospirota bacterium]